MNIIKQLFLIVIAFSAAESNADADLMYTFGQSEYFVSPGGAVDIDVFLTESGSSSILTDSGLLSGSVRVLFDTGLPASDPSVVSSLAGIKPNPAFDDSLLGANLDLDMGVSAGFADSVDLFSPPLVGSSILLGTFTFTGGSIVGDTSEITAVDFDPLLSDTISGDLASLDTLIQSGTARIHITPIPEPRSLAMFAAGLFVILVNRSVKRTRAKSD